MKDKLALNVLASFHFTLHFIVQGFTITMAQTVVYIHYVI